MSEMTLMSTVEVRIRIKKKILLPKLYTHLPSGGQSALKSQLKGGATNSNALTESTIMPLMLRDSDSKVRNECPGAQWFVVLQDGMSKAVKSHGLLFTHLISAVFFNFSPNPGFMFQLHLFEAMGKKVDKSNSLYKQYNLQIIAKKVQETGE